MWFYHVGPQWAKRLMMSGDCVSGKDAARIGLVLDAVPASELDAEVAETARRISCVDNELLSVHKRIVNMALELSGARNLQRLAAEADSRAHLSTGPRLSQFKADMASAGLTDRHHLHKPIIEQSEFNLLRPRRIERDLMRLCDDTGIGVAAYSPLCGGTLTGKYLHGAPEGSHGADPNNSFQSEIYLGRERNRIVGDLMKFAEALDCAMGRLALAWCLAQPHLCTAVTGVSKPSQFEDSLQALEVLPKITPQMLTDMAATVGDFSGEAYQVPQK